MDTRKFRILDTLSSYLGTPLSIHQLTEKIRDTYGTGHYANIYGKSHELEEQGILTFYSFGKSSIIKLNFQNYLLPDFMAEIEIKKKLDFLIKRKDLFIFLSEMEKYLSDICSIKSICSIDPMRNIKLNKMEFLFLLGLMKDASTYAQETVRIHNKLRKLQDKHNLRINSLILGKQDFSDLILSDEINPLREALISKTAFFCPQAFWSEIREIAEKTEIRSIRTATKPTEFDEVDLIYNLARFGYKEFGPKIEEGKKFCIEYIITTILLQGNARQIEAIPIILAKNDFKTNLLIFLSEKFGTSGRLLGLLRILQNKRPTEKIEQTIKILESFDLEEIQADEASILEKMITYNVAGQTVTI